MCKFMYTVTACQLMFKVLENTLKILFLSINICRIVMNTYSLLFVHPT